MHHTSASVPFNLLYDPAAAPPKSTMTLIPFFCSVLTSSQITSLTGDSNASLFNRISPGFSCRCIDARMMWVTFVSCSKSGSSDNGFLSGVVNVCTYITRRGSGFPTTACGGNPVVSGACSVDETPKTRNESMAEKSFIVATLAHGARSVRSQPPDVEIQDIAILKLERKEQTECSARKLTAVQTALFSGERDHPPMSGLSPQISNHYRSIKETVWMVHLDELSINAPIQPHLEGVWRGRCSAGLASIFLLWAPLDPYSKTVSHLMLWYKFRMIR
jgi:hypothetical protein